MINFKALIKRLREITIAYIAKIQDGIAVFLRFSVIKAKEILLPIQRMFGYKVLKDPNEAKKLDTTVYLSETDARLAELPRDYVDLFIGEIAPDDPVLVRTDSHQKLFKKALEVWKSQKSTNLAIVGEDGSGKTTLVNGFCDMISEDNPQLIEFSESVWETEKLISSLADFFGFEGMNKVELFIRKVNNLEKPRIVVLEGLQNLYLRTLNGYSALETLWLVLSETKEKIFWIVTCSSYAWDFLNKSFGVEANFSYTLRCDTLNVQQIEQVIQNRHARSDYSLVFEPNEVIRKSRSFKKRLDNPKKIQEYLKELYFEKLAEVAEGNCSIALTLWLRSIKKVDGNTIVILPVEVASLELLESMTPEILFSLAAIVLHDTLRVSELSKILQTPLSETRVLINRLKSKGIVVGEGQQYRLNHLIYRQSLRALKHRNIIH